MCDIFPGTTLCSAFMVENSVGDWDDESDASGRPAQLEVVPGLDSVVQGFQSVVIDLHYQALQILTGIVGYLNPPYCLRRGTRDPRLFREDVSAGVKIKALCQG